MTRQVFRTAIPVDDSWHTIELSGPIVHVATRFEDYIEIWFINDPAATPQLRAFRTLGTGHPLPPAAATHIGTAVTPSGNLVWHLFEHERLATP
jgi:hypothetical protein